MAIEKGLYGMPEGIDEELAMGEMGGEMAPDAMIEMAIATDEDMPVRWVERWLLMKTCLS
jgi:hypothetical protein